MERDCVISHLLCDVVILMDSHVGLDKLVLVYLSRRHQDTETFDWSSGDTLTVYGPL